MRTIRMIETLANANGLSGFEDEVAVLVRRYAEPYGICVEDAIRNVLLERKENKGNRPVVVLDAHTDEVGFLVQYIDQRGLLHFILMGIWNMVNLGAQPVRVRTRTGEYIPGVIAVRPPHFLRENEPQLLPDVKEMVVDIGACSKREAVEEFGVYPGAPIIPDTAFSFDEKTDLLRGKAFDDRLGCAAIVDILEGLAGEELEVDVKCAFCAQEEIGTRGIAVAAETLSPDLAIVFEGCPADDTFMPEDAIQTALRKGPMLRHYDCGMVTNPRFQRYALDLAKECGIPTQEAVRTGGYTDARVLHMTRKATPSIVIGVPVRNGHTHNGISAYSDYQYSVQLGMEILRRMNKELIAEF